MSFITLIHSNQGQYAEVEGLKKQAFLNEKQAVERKRKTAEEKLIEGALSNEEFGRIKERHEEKLEKICNRLFELELQHNIDIDLLRDALKLTRNVDEAQKSLP